MNTSRYERLVCENESIFSGSLWSQAAADADDDDADENAAAAASHVVTWWRSYDLELDKSQHVTASQLRRRRQINDAQFASSRRAATV